MVVRFHQKFSDIDLHLRVPTSGTMFHLQKSCRDMPDLEFKFLHITTKNSSTLPAQDRHLYISSAVMSNIARNISTAIWDIYLQG